MCGIAAIYSGEGVSANSLRQRLAVMNHLQRHRGPDGHGVWVHKNGHIGFGHRRLSIIDLDSGHQPMTTGSGNWITYNGEIYNYIELRQELGAENFKTKSDTEVILMAYQKWGADCLDHLRGMFAFALWDQSGEKLVCARDPFGIKPFYYTVIKNVFYCSSEVKALLPFVPNIEIDTEGLKDYLSFQFVLDGKTLFEGIHELLPGHRLIVKNGSLKTSRYWEVVYQPDMEHDSAYFEEKLQYLIEDSVSVHLRADVPVGSYLSGGLDSGIVASLASQTEKSEFKAFTGKFSAGEGYDESPYARDLAKARGFELLEMDITSKDFTDNIQKIFYHLDFPVAGPGAFPQYMVSELASRHRKVVLGGQGGDEIFGGYARYLIAYFEQCIKGAIEGTMNSGNFVVTYESIIPNLQTLKAYKPLLQDFWKEGLFGKLDERYFRLIDRSRSLKDIVNWPALGKYSEFDTFRKVFRADNVGKESYFDSMTHFDFKTLLPSLLQVEDRVSMAHGLESRVPFLDKAIVEFAATLPADVKFRDGNLKYILKQSMGHVLPDSIRNRKDKMGFPVPLNEWIQGELNSFFLDCFHSSKAKTRMYLIPGMDLDGMIRGERKFGRSLWGLLSLELWQQQFHDRQSYFQGLLKEEALEAQEGVSNKVGLSGAES